MINNIYNLPEINFVGGTSEKFVFHVYRNGQTPLPLDLYGGSANFAIVNCINKSVAPMVAKNMSITAANGDAAANVLTVTLDPADTLDLSGKFIYQVTMRDIDGNVEEPQQGIVYIHNNIDKGFLRN